MFNPLQMEGFSLIMNIFTRTIHPAPNYNTQWTTAIHGLTYDDTIEAEEGK